MRSNEVWKEKIEASAEKLGCKLLWGKEIKPGDMYLAVRNGPEAKLYTCKRVYPRFWIESTDPIAYPYDTCECVKVE